MSEKIVPPPASAGQPWTFLLLALAAALAAFGKTRIGWPTSKDVGCIFAFSLLVVAVVLLLSAAVFRRVPPLLLPVSMLVAVLAILQWLPEAESGLVILPNLPWSYSGWIPVWLSVAAWFLLLLAILTSGAHDAAVVVPLCLLWMLGLSFPLSLWSGGRTAIEPVVPSPWEQVSEWRTKQDEAEQVLANLRSDRERLARCLSRLGVQSSEDLNDVPAACPVARELAEVVKQIRDVESSNQRLDLAIAEIESKLRRVDRWEAIGEAELTDEEEKELTRRGLELEEELGSSILEVEHHFNGLLSE